MIRGRAPAADQQRTPEAQAPPAPTGGKINTCIYNYLLYMWPTLSIDYILCKTMSIFESFFLRKWAQVCFPLSELGVHVARPCVVPLHAAKNPWVHACIVSIFLLHSSLSSEGRGIGKSLTLCTLCCVEC